MASNNDKKKRTKELADQTREREVLQMTFGKVPPQAKDIEEAILGAIMLETFAFDKVNEMIHPEVFYVYAHQIIYEAMIRLSVKSQPIDILSVSEELRAMEKLEECGGPYYVTKLTNTVVSSAHIENHARIIYQKYIQREMINLGGKLITGGYEDITDVFDLLDEAETALYDVSNALHRKNYVGIDNLLVKAVQEVETARHSNQQISGVTSGFPSIDQITYGWQKPDLIILAARPSVGKTALALSLARNAALDPFKPTPVAFFSLEMSGGQLIKRLMSSESEIPLIKIQRGRMEEQDMKDLYQRGVQMLSNAKIYIDDTASMNIFELRAKARRLKQKHDIGLIIVDYLQLMSGTGSSNSRNREQEISEISRGLKRIAKELDIPVIALSQLSREPEKRADKIPQLSDLRESGAIEQDADIVAFIYRPEYYGIHIDKLGESNPGETHIKFAKNRNGVLETVKLRAQLWIQKFKEWDAPILKSQPGQQPLDQGWTQFIKEEL